jgi:hypothetical protein
MEWIEHINAALVFEPEYAASKKNTKNNAVPLMEKCHCGLASGMRDFHPSAIRLRLEFTSTRGYEPPRSLK